MILLPNLRHSAQLIDHALKSYIYQAILTLEITHSYNTASASYTAKKKKAQEMEKCSFNYLALFMISLLLICSCKNIPAYILITILNISMIFVIFLIAKHILIHTHDTCTWLSCMHTIYINSHMLAAACAYCR